ncbi:MAG: HD domain-containing protein [Erysipelotrichaceae bacterium]|nr:HD domain-containing protein [Erysipelotrichaceae bacterium]
MDNTIIENAKRYIEQLFADNADGHDSGHSLRVYRNAVKIAEKYPESDLFLISLASLLHDADDHKLFHTENNENARSFLSSQNIGAETTERICRIINAVSFSKNRGKRPDSLEGKIVQDADRLDAIGAVGIARTFAYGGKNERPMESSIQHFYDKLLLLKEEMNTEEARALAEKRHAFMEEFLRAYFAETEDPHSD